MKIEVIIGQFRNLYNRHFVFDEGINLLSGKNGSGKSNTFSAMEWCVFGTCLDGTPLPHGKRKAKVEIKCDKFHIVREKGPELLKLYMNDIEYKDKEASTMIESMFGSHEVWKASSYIPQECRCQLLSGTKEQQIHTLNSVIFSNTDPSEIQKKIDQVRKRKEQEIQMLRAKMEGLKMHLCEDIGNQLDTFSSDQIGMMCQMLEMQIQTKETSERQRLNYASQKQVWLQQKQEQEIKIHKLKEANLTFLDNPTMDRLEEEIFRMEAQIASLRLLLQQISTLEMHQKQKIMCEEEMKKLEFTVEECATFSQKVRTENEWKRLQYNEMLYSQNEEKCKKLNVSYDSEVISNAIKETQAIIEQYKVYEEVQKVLKQMKPLENIYLLFESPRQEVQNVEKQRLERLEKINVELSMMEQNKRLLECPHCSKPLQYKAGKLHASEGFVVQEKVMKKLYEEKRDLEQKGDYYRMMSMQYAKYKEWKQYVEGKNVSGEVSLKLNYSELISVQYQKLETLKSISFVKNDDGDTCENAKTYYRRWKGSEWYRMWKGYDEQMKTFLNENQIMKDHNYNTQQITQQCQYLEQILRKVKEFQQKWLHTTQLLKQCDEALSAIPHMEDMSTQLEMDKETLKNMRIKYEERRRWEESQKVKSVYDGVNEEKGSLEAYVSKVEVLKDICRKVQAERIDFSLETLNIVANDVLKEMFEEPIHLELSSLKELKSGKVKNELNLLINHNQTEVKTLRPGLSIGQASRVSIALCLALHILSPHPFILMDEPFAPVDAQMINKSLQAMKEVLPNGRVCIVSAHHTNGLYDNEISI